MRFGEDICSLIPKENMLKMNHTTNNFTMNKVTVGLNMFGALMVDIIVGNLNSTTIITMKNSGTIMNHTHISEKPPKPNQLPTVSAKTRYSTSALV